MLFDKLLPLELPKDVNQIIQELATKQASLQQWESISYTLFKARRIEDFLSITKYITEYVIGRYNDEVSKRIKIRLYNSLSMFYLVQATKQDVQDRASENFDNVVKNFNLSDKYDFDGLTFSIKGIYSFYRGEKNQTLDYFKTSQDQIQVNEVSSIHPLIGMAQVYFAIGDYKEALQYFKKALRGKFRIPGKVRLGLAYCYYNLEQYSMAYYAFVRVLQLEPKNIEAHIGIAVIYFHKGDYDSYFKYIILAFHLDRLNPVVLYHLAEHYLFRLQYERALKCLKTGFKALDNISRFQYKDKQQDEPFRNDWADLKSRYLYLLGLLRQIHGDYDSAFKYYNQSKQYNRNNMLLQFSLSQIYLNTQYLNYNESYKLTEKLLKQYDSTPFIHELYKSAAYVHSKNLQNKKQVLDTYRKALQYQPLDSEILIEYAQQLENEDAAQYYQTAEQVLTQKGQKKLIQLFQQQTDQIIFPELYINMGVHFINRSLQLAQQSFTKCEQILEGFQIPEYVVETSEEASKQEVQLKKSVYQLVLAYNKGIVMEAIGDYAEAELLWQSCIKINPFFIDSYVRLSYLLHNMGRSQEAIKILQDSMVFQEQVIQHNKSYRPYNPIPMMYGYIAQQIQDDVTAKDQFKINIDDCYSKISLMAHDYSMAADRTKNSDQGFLKTVLRQLATNASKILSHDSKNIQAAMILVLIMAEVGRPQEALAQLENLLEYSNVQPRIVSNLAILESFIGNEENYQSGKLYFKKFYEKIQYKPDEHTDVHQAQMHLNYRNYQDAGNCIKRQIMNNPGNMQHRLNLNMIIHQQCFEIVEDPKSKSKFTQLSQAIEYFKCLMRSYEYMFKSACWQSREQHHPPHLRAHIRATVFQPIREKSDVKFTFINTYQNNFSKILREAEEYEKLQIQKQLQLQEERKKKLQEINSITKQEQDELDLKAIEELEQVRQKFFQQLQYEQEQEQQMQNELQQMKGGKRKKLTKKEKLEKEKIKRTEEEILQSDDESFNSQDANQAEMLVREDLGDNSEQEFEEQEQFEQKKSKPKKTKKKEKVKSKKRLLRQVDSDNEQDQGQAQENAEEEDYNVFS